MSVRSRSVLAAVLMACAAACTAPAYAQSSQVSADYAVSFLGLSIGRGTMVSTGDGRTYRTTLEAEVTGIAALFAGGTGTAVATGRLTPTAAVPSSFSIETRSGSKVETTRIAMTAGNVTSIERNPDKPPHPRATPVLPEHLRGVLDPLSAGIFLAGGSGPVTGAAACDRRAPVFRRARAIRPHLLLRRDPAGRDRRLQGRGGGLPRPLRADRRLPARPQRHPECPPPLGRGDPGAGARHAHPHSGAHLALDRLWHRCRRSDSPVARRHAAVTAGLRGLMFSTAWRLGYGKRPAGVPS